MSTSQSLYEAVLAGRLEVFNAYIAAGKGTPFIYPWDTLPALYLFIGIVVRPHLSPVLARTTGYVAFAAIIIHSSFILTYRRCLGFAGGYGVGLATIWGIIMTAVWLLIHEPEKDFVRLEIRESAAATTYTQTSEGVSYSIEKDTDSKELRDRQQTGAAHVFEPKKSKQNKIAAPYRLIWQPFPTEPLHCIDWTVDFMTSFRGPNFNFRSPGLPKLKTIPPPAQYSITRAIEPSMMANEMINPSDPSAILAFQKAILSTIRWYILVDIVKCIMITDPYFLGLRQMDSQSPWPFLQDRSHFYTKLARMAVSLTGVQTWLSLIFSLSPLCFYAMLPYLISQSTLIQITKAPLYDPRMYTPLFSSMNKNILGSGLAGFWGRYWHQMFRYGISEPSKPIVKALNVNPRSQLGRAIQLLVAFGLTGTIHAAASATTFSIIPSKPSRAFLFFFSQGIGIMIQTSIAQVLNKVMKTNPSQPSMLKKLGNLAFVLVWLWFTGPLLANDFARAGIWLFEPVPVSFLRGVMGRGWWVWTGNGRWVGWWKGSAWWNTGIAFY